MKQLKTVFKFEYNSYIKNKVFVIITLVFTAAIILGINAPNISGIIGSFTGGGYEGEFERNGGGAVNGETGTAAVSAPINDYPDELLSEFFPNYTFVRYPSFDEGYLRERIAAGDYEFAMGINGMEYTMLEPGQTMFGSARSARLMMVYVHQNKLAYEMGISGEDIERIRDINPIRVFIEPVGADLAQTFWVGYAMLFLLYLTIQFYGQMVLVSVVTEKSSKAMELLITSVKPVYLMFGKVLGSGLAGLTQLVVFLAAAVAAFSFAMPQWQEFSPNVSAIMGLSLNVEILLFALLFFALGFFIFAFLFAGFGSTVSRMEDANKVVMVPLMLFMASFFVAMFGGMSAPTSTFYVVASFIPFLSPLVMFMRICLELAQPHEIAIAVVINIVSVVAVGILSAKIYRTGVLMYGKPMKFTEIVKQLVKA